MTVSRFFCVFTAHTTARGCCTPNKVSVVAINLSTAITQTSPVTRVVFAAKVHFYNEFTVSFSGNVIFQHIYHPYFVVYIISQSRAKGNSELYSVVKINTRNRNSSYCKSCTAPVRAWVAVPNRQEWGSHYRCAAAVQQQRYQSWH